ncbi:hypothetical protein MT391_03340 [Vibrio sp. 1-Bac 57]
MTWIQIIKKTIIKKTKLTFVLAGALLLTLPMSQAFAHAEHCESKDTELGETMKYMKSELRAYVKGFKTDDAKKMQKHLNELLMLSDKASQYMPVMITKMQHADSDKSKMKEMDHAKMDMSVMSNMQGMNVEQHNQKQKYVTEIKQLNSLFNALNATKDETEIKAILNKIQTQTKKGHKQFRQNCKK